MITNQALEKKIAILTNKLKVGLLDEVISDAKRLLKVSKNQIIFNILSLAYQAKGNYDESIKILEQPIKSSPKNIFFLNNLGLSYFKKNDLQKAEYFFKRAMEVNPNYLNVLNNYGNLKKELELFKDAIEYFKKALLLNKNNLQVNYNLGVSYQGIGDYINAIKYYEKASNIEPKFTKSDRSISSMTEYTSENKHFISMKKKILDTTLNDSQKLELYFALGKAYEDIKDYKKSFDNIKFANTLRKKQTNYNIFEDKKLFDKIKEFFDNVDYIPAKANKVKIIFILGMPRSGTSITEQIISSHPKVFGGGELTYLDKIIKQKILDNSNFKDNINKNKVFDEVQNEYISKILNKSKDFLNFTDKSPLNFWWIGFILNIFPNSKIVHCKRDKMDICWSNYKNQFEGGLNFSNDFKDLSEYYKIYDNLMKFWKEKFKNQIYDLDHDTLINNPEDTIKNLINFCELEWDEKCLKPEENKRPIKTVSFKQARNPIYTQKNKNHILFDKYLGDLKKYLFGENSS
tara:strand:- start:232 stop:1782 length:1551 start_codon:yes stop_codon:yes gene_type:complete